MATANPFAMLDEDGESSAPAAASSDAAAFSRNLKLSRGFLSVQALLCSIGAAAFPGAASVFGFAAFECMLTLAARELIEGLPRANEKLGWAWAAVIANWIPFLWLYVDIFVPAYVYFVGMFLWVHWTFYITLFMIPSSTRRRRSGRASPRCWSASPIPDELHAYRER